jgi:NADH-quinone oxidoreductase subunit L
MNGYIGLIPGLPLISFLILVFFGRLIPRKVTGIIAVGSVSLSALLTIITGLRLLNEPAGTALSTTLYTWMNAGGFMAGITLKLDALSLIFCFVITFVGALIHLYSVEFMKDDEGFARFFAYMNLFVGSMLILVLAGNLLLLYLGWEGVGLCSYLLIGFWYKEPGNNDAARKAFIVTRIGDTFMIIGLFLLFVSFGTLDIDSVMQQAAATWSHGSALATVSALLLLGGALGKSAQLPLQTWLPDAMAGPSPVSALIHAATMVTAGVYLIARTHVLFSLAPMVQTTVAVIGAATLVIAGFSALNQHDLKRVLAYSTISQIGYMFLALGVGAWSAAIFHFMIHAFFKALLFLAAGSVIQLLHEEHHMHNMGGLRKKLPVVFITFLIGGASLSALPLITAGFYSKDQILWLSWSSVMGSKWLWLAGICGALITSAYTFRMIFLTFFGSLKIQPRNRPGLLMTLPLVVLALLSIIGGFIEMPENLGPVRLFSRLLSPVFPVVHMAGESLPEWLFQLLSAIISIGGIWIAYVFYYQKRKFPALFNQPALNGFFYSGWGFDRLYDQLFVKPVVWLSEIDKNDVLDKIYNSIARISVTFNGLLSRAQNGRLRLYALVLTAGIVILLTIILAT